MATRLPETGSEIDALEAKLSSLAYQWRKLRTTGHPAEADNVVQEYHAVFARLWQLGWDGEGLLPDSELPGELMPESWQRNKTDENRLGGDSGRRLLDGAF